MSGCEIQDFAQEVTHAGRSIHKRHTHTAGTLLLVDPRPTWTAASGEVLHGATN